MAITNRINAGLVCLLQRQTAVHLNSLQKVKDYFHKTYSAFYPSLFLIVQS